jgi:CspA family cold shock protein
VLTITLTTITKRRDNNNMSTLKGKVKWFNGTKGFGFIEREDKEKDVFVHVSAVRDAGLDYLNEGDEMSFEVEDGPKGPNATSLQKI